MLYDDSVPSGTWLAHHGIKGQKWGEKNGNISTHGVGA
jgi:hypothetical protein